MTKPKLSEFPGDKEERGIKNRLSEFPVKDGAAAAQLLLQRIVADLKESAGLKATGDRHLFFPNGIELINVVVKVGSGDVEVMIAGEKSVKPSDGKSTLVRNLSNSTDYMDANANVNVEPIFRGDYLIWFNEKAGDVKIHFTPLCPLNRNDFIVPGNGLLALTLVQTTIEPGSYSFRRSPESGIVPAGDPKIIIK